MNKLKILLLAALPVGSFAQCPQPTCQGTVTFPISVNDYNNGSGVYSGFGPNRCISGNGIFTNNLNEIGGWTSWSFNGAIAIQQIINVNHGKRLYLSGNIQLFGFSMAGGADSAIIYASGTVTLPQPQNCNNFYNYIYLATGTTLTIGGVQYQPGDTYQGQGNSTNVIHIMACSVPLPIKILEFRMVDNMIYWKVDNVEKILIEYSSDGKNFVPFYQTDIQAYMLAISRSGYYRLKLEDSFSLVYSKILSFNTKGEKPERLIYFNGHYFQSYPFPNMPYQGTKPIK